MSRKQRRESRRRRAHTDFAMGSVNEASAFEEEDLEEQDQAQDIIRKLQEDGELRRKLERVILMLQKFN